MRKHTSTTVFKCSLCLGRFQNISELRNHRRKVHNTNEAQTRRHRKLKHPDTADINAEEKVLTREEHLPVTEYNSQSNKNGENKLYAEENC